MCRSHFHRRFISRLAAINSRLAGANSRLGLLRELARKTLIVWVFRAEERSLRREIFEKFPVRREKPGFHSRYEHLPSLLRNDAAILLSPGAAGRKNGNGRWPRK
jgi:hypothetical protein